MVVEKVDNSDDDGADGEDCTISDGFLLKELFDSRSTHSDCDNPIKKEDIAPVTPVITVFALLETPKDPTFYEAVCSFPNLLRDSVEILAFTGYLFGLGFYSDSVLAVV